MWYGRNKQIQVRHFHIKTNYHTYIHCSFSTNKLSVLTPRSVVFNLASSNSQSDNCSLFAYPLRVFYPRPMCQNTRQIACNGKHVYMYLFYYEWPKQYWTILNTAQFDDPNTFCYIGSYFMSITVFIGILTLRKVTWCY